MSEIELHIRENSPESESHLEQNKDKFQSDCRIVLRELYKGRRLTDKILSEQYGVADWGRRLRDVAASRQDIKREWVRTPDGKRTRYKEFWMEIPRPASKTRLTHLFQNQIPFP